MFRFFSRILTDQSCWIAMSPGVLVPHMGYTYLVRTRAFSNLSVFNCRNIKPFLPNFLGRAIVILNFVRRFRNFNGRKHFCNKVYRNQNFTVT